MSDKRQVLPGDTVTRADLILGGLPFAFATTYGVGVVVLETQLLAVGIAALVCLLVVVDAVVFHPPFS